MMTRNFKNTAIASLAALLTVAAATFLADCGGDKRNPIDGKTDQEGGGTIRTYEAAERAIAAMDSADWESPAVYKDVEAFSISARSSLGESDKLALKKKLKARYSEQLVRTVSHILGSGCAKRHATLTAAVAELEGTDFGGYVPDGRQAALQRYKTHQEQMRFAISPAYSVGVSSFKEGYDDTYDRKKRAEAAAIRATNPTCTAIRDKVDEANVDKALRQRRQNYYAALVRRFCATTDITTYEYQQMLSKVGSAPQPDALRLQVKAHWDKINSAASAEPAPAAW